MWFTQAGPRFRLPVLTAIITINLLPECPLNCGLFSALDFTAEGEGEHSGFMVEAL